MPTSTATLASVAALVQLMGALAAKGTPCLCGRRPPLYHERARAQVSRRAPSSCPSRPLNDAAQFSRAAVAAPHILAAAGGARRSRAGRQRDRRDGRHGRRDRGRLSPHERPRRRRLLAHSRARRARARDRSLRLRRRARDDRQLPRPGVRRHSPARGHGGADGSRRDRRLDGGARPFEGARRPPAVEPAARARRAACARRLSRLGLGGAFRPDERSRADRRAGLRGKPS